MCGYIIAGSLEKVRLYTHQRKADHYIEAQETMLHFFSARSLLYKSFWTNSPIANVRSILTRLAVLLIIVSRVYGIDRLLQEYSVAETFRKAK